MDKCSKCYITDRAKTSYCPDCKKVMKNSQDIPMINVLDKIRAEISCNIVEDDTSGNTPNRLRADWSAANKAHMIDIAIIDKYKAEAIQQERSGEE